MTFSSTAHPGRAPVSIAKHPLVQDMLARMRVETTGIGDFWQLLQRITPALFFEATKGLPEAVTTVPTPLEMMNHQVLSKNFTMIFVARAGFGFDGACKALYPDMLSGYIDAERNEQSLETEVTSIKLPKEMTGMPAIVADPMLATGNTAIEAVKAAFDAGATEVTFMCLLTAPEGIEKLQATYPNVSIVTAALDRQLNDKGYIVPGLGDAGNRMYGTK